jgi:hypothetical protein
MSGKDKLKRKVRLGREMAGEIGDTSLANDNRGQVAGGAQRAVNIVVGLMVGGLIAAFLLPVAIDEIVAVDTTNWGSGASSLWDVLDLIVVLAVFLFFIGIALQNRM